MFLKPSETAKSYKRGSQALSMAQKKPVPAWPKLSKGNLPSALSGTFFETTLRNAVRDVSFGRLHERTTDEGTDRTAECARNEMLLPYALSPVPLSSRPSTFVPELRMKAVQGFPPHEKRQRPAFRPVQKKRPSEKRFPNLCLLLRPCHALHRNCSEKVTCVAALALFVPQTFSAPFRITHLTLPSSSTEQTIRCPQDTGRKHSVSDRASADVSRSRLLKKSPRR